MSPPLLIFALGEHGLSFLLSFFRWVVNTPNSTIGHLSNFSAQVGIFVPLILLRILVHFYLSSVDIWERNKELIRKRTNIGEHFTRDVIQSIVFIFLPLGERLHLTNPAYYY